jgi:hypothetical protein
VKGIFRKTSTIMDGLSILERELIKLKRTGRVIALLDSMKLYDPSGTGLAWRETTSLLRTRGII